MPNIFSKDANDCPAFIANDGCLIKELVQPKNDQLDLPYSLAVATVEPSKQTYPHYLHQAELYYIVKGCGRLNISKSSLLSNGKRDENEYDQLELTAGGTALVPAGHEQWLENTGTCVLEFLVIVSPPWNEKDDIRT